MSPAAIALGALGAVALLSNRSSTSAGSATQRTVGRSYSEDLSDILGSFTRPSRFKGLVSVIRSQGGQVSSIHHHSYKSTAGDSSGWNPASTVKLYAAVSALSRVEKLGFTRDVELTFYGGNREYTASLSALIENAVGPSDNIDYNRLVQVSGYDFINCVFLSLDNGFTGTVLRRAYAQTEWKGMGESASFSKTPPILFYENGSEYLSPELSSSCTPAIECMGSACTNLIDLAECMIRTIMPVPDRLISRQSSDWIGEILSSKRSRGEEVVSRLRQRLEQTFEPGSISIYHKAGYAGEWYSDNALVVIDGLDESYSVALCGYPGRDALNSAASAIGEAIATGAFIRQGAA